MTEKTRKKSTEDDSDAKEDGEDKEPSLQDALNTVPETESVGPLKNKLGQIEENGLVEVEFKQDWRGSRQGEIVGYGSETADILVTQGFAMYPKLTKAEREREAAKEAKKQAADVERAKQAVAEEDKAMRTGDVHNKGA